MGRPVNILTDMYLRKLTIVVAVTAACSSSGGGGASEPSSTGAATVVRGSELGTNLLAGLRARVPGMSVSYPQGECPRIIFRGVRSVTNQGNPTVYVDDTRMLDTCILTQIPSSDVDYVEVFPSGNTMQPGIERNPFGLLMVYRVRQ